MALTPDNTTPDATADANKEALLAAALKGGVGSKDLAGLMGANLKINPWLAGVGVASAIPTGIQALRQGNFLAQLRRQGIQDVTPAAFRQYQQGIEQRRYAGLPGMGMRQDMLNSQLAESKARVDRAAVTPAQRMEAEFALNRQGMAGRRQLGIEAGQANLMRGKEADQGLLQKAAYQDKGRNEYNLAQSALMGAQAQGWNNFVQGLAGAGLNSLQIQLPKTKPDNTVPVKV